jgi:hypothetical protein
MSEFQWKITEKNENKKVFVVNLKDNYMNGDGGDRLEDGLFNFLEEMKSLGIIPKYDFIRLRQMGLRADSYLGDHYYDLYLEYEEGYIKLIGTVAHPKQEDIDLSQTEIIFYYDK